MKLNNGYTATIRDNPPRLIVDIVYKKRQVGNIIVTTDTDGKQWIDTTITGGTLFRSIEELNRKRLDLTAVIECHKRLTKPTIPDELSRRLGYLTDKKHLHGLTPNQGKELQALNNEIDKIFEPYNKIIMNSVKQMLQTQYHIMYTLNGKFNSVLKHFENFEAVEKWLKSIGASYWEIG